MAKAHIYLAAGANVEATDTFASWIDTTNALVFDMGTVVLTSVSQPQPNVTVGGYTTGNAHLQGILSANTLVASNNLRGGSVSIPGDLTVVSNTIFSESPLVRISANTDNFTVNSNNTTFTSNVAINSSKTVLISAANTTINAGQLFVRTNSEFTGTRVDIDGTTFDVTSNTIFTSATFNANADVITLGFNGSDALTVNAVSDFNANVNIDGVLFTVTSTNTTIGDSGTDKFNVIAESIFSANATFNGALVNITSANTTIGDAPADRLNVNAVSDFNANVNIDGILTQTANAIFSGALVNITSANTTIGDAPTDVLNVNATSDFNANVNIDGILTQTANAIFSGALVNITSVNTTIGDAPTDALNVNAVSDFNANVNVDGIFTVANSATVSNTLTVNVQANTASLMVRDLTATRIPYVGVAGEIVDSANVTFSGTNLNIIGTANVTSNANVGGTFGVTGAATLASTLAVTGVATFSSNAVFSDNDYIVVGTGADLQIYHDGSHSYITDAGTGNLKIDASQLDIQTSNSTATETMATFVRDGAVTLFHDNTARLATSGTGVSVTGTLGVSTNATVSGTLNVAGVTTLANTTVGAAPTDVFNVNAVSDFNANVNVDGILTVVNSATISNTLTVNTQANTASLMVRDLTATRIPYVGVGGEIVDSANVTFSGTNLNVIGTANVTSNANVGGTFGVTGAATLASTLSVTGTTSTTAINASGLVDVTNATDATSTTAAALKTAGGLAVAKKLYVGGIVEASANVNITGTGNRISAPDAAITNNMTVGGTATIVNLNVTGTTVLNTDAQLSLNNATTAHSTITDDLTLTNATIIGSVVPDVNNTYDIGTGSLNWKTVYANNVVANVAWSSITDKPDPVVTVTLTGDVQGTASATLTDLSSNTISISTTIQPNSVALGTDTTGNYVGTLSVTTPGVANGSSGLTFTGVAGEGTIAAIAHANTSTVTNLSVDNSAGNVLQDISLTFDAFGHVTGRTITSTDLDLRYPQTSFTNIAVAGQSTVISDSLTDTLTLVGAGITTITTNATTDTITITATEADTLASVTSRGNTTTNSITVNDINANNAVISGGLTVSGDLTVSGTTTYINTQTLNVGDNIVTLNADVTGAPNQNAGVEIERGDANNAVLLWNESTDRWTFTNNGVNYFNIPVSSEYDNYTSWTIQDGGANTYTITSGDTLQIASGTYITSLLAADDVLTISHNNTTRSDTTSTASPTYAGTFTAVDGVTTNATGHITAVNVKTVTLPAGTNLTATAGTTAGPVVNSSTGTGVTIPSASNTASGIITTAAQNIAGAKTFESTIIGSINGNANTATALQTPRFINAVSFNGTANVEINTLRTTSGANIIDGTAQSLPVNHLQVRAANTAQDVLITTAGSDTNVNLSVQTKGTGSIALDTGVGAGNIDIKPGTGTLRVWDNTATNWHSVVVGELAANRTITLPDGNVTLQTGTMAITGGTLAQFAATTSSALAGVISDETGTGSLVFSASPTFTGTPLAPTAAVGTNTTQIATTAFVNAEIANDIVTKANIASPTFTGTPLAPTAAVGTNTTQIATTAFVNAEIAADIVVKADVASPTFTGVVTAPRLSLTSTTDANTTSTGHALQIGLFDNIHLVMDNNEIQARLDDTASTLNLNVSGGNVTIGASTSTINLRGTTQALDIIPSVNNTYDLGSTTSRWAVMYGTATSARYADLAEKYLADDEYPVGTVMSVGGEAEVTAATPETAHSVIGVVSENPAYLMNDGLEGGTAIALKGRVPVKIIGTVKKGDRLTPSSEKGFAEVNNSSAAWAFAIALADSDNGLVEAIIL